MIETDIAQHIAHLQTRIKEEQEATYHDIQRIEHERKQRVRDAQRYFMERVEPLRQELDAVVKLATAKHAYDPIPPITISRDVS